jgi:transcriptional regulator with XRE-family HTH domain
MAKSTKTFGSVLRARREELGLSVRGLAQAVDLAPSSISRLEEDSFRATEETVRRLAKVLRSSTDELLALSRGNLPHFDLYLRAKYDLSPEEIAELDAHFQAVTAKGKSRKAKS